MQIFYFAAMKKCFAAILAASTLCSGGAALADVMPSGMSDEMPDGMSDEMSPGMSDEMSPGMSEEMPMNMGMDDQMHMDMDDTQMDMDDQMHMDMDDTQMDMDDHMHMDMDDMQMDMDDHMHMDMDDMQMDMDDMYMDMASAGPDMRCSLGFATGATFPTNKLKGDNKVGDRETGSGESTLDTALTFDASVQCPIIDNGRGSLGLTLTRFTSSFDEIKIKDKVGNRNFTAKTKEDQNLDVSATSLILDYTHSFKIDRKWTPYVGAGVGITWSFVEDQEFSNDSQMFLATVNEDTNGSFSFRIKAGTEYAINDAWGLYGEVRYGHSSGFTSNNGITYGNGTEADVDYESFGGISTVAGVRIRF
ncbi:MAG: autotransporter domain-containing protein [Aphanocapsa feldmannii 277cV]|uniref:Autotransporter domain-containing protein n=1 Tax=Aphanocapsa feldmannii 277cV TaxID=2507553 RepID=A0A524RKJ1_9CHRO|nr:MAG: autotransporter domain-containing protein [Aphanocapsa feldmannii 277cV]